METRVEQKDLTDAVIMSNTAGTNGENDGGDGQWKRSRLR
jgi:hypothetical protein